MYSQIAGLTDVRIHHKSGARADIPELPLRARAGSRTVFCRRHMDPPQLVAAAIGGISLVAQRFFCRNPTLTAIGVVLIVPCAVW